MKYKIVILIVLVLHGNLEVFSQISVEGCCINYEYGSLMPGVSVNLHTPSGDKNGALTDNKGNFKVKIGDETECLIFKFIGCYAVKILNIPKGVKHIDLGEIKLVENYGDVQCYTDGSIAETPKGNIEKDQNIKKDVLENYRIKVCDEILTPSFEEEYIVFDFKKETR
ncbi:hypothetical protein EYV94_12440 [Puteibacter caeruleilacunae]|nr:hypothetical protein EYV94_12440 [Puteibacter caeruleilacunae]